MPAPTGCRRKLDSAPHIFDVGNWLKVIWIAARANAAFVIEFLAGRNLTN